MNDTLLFLCLAILFLSPGFFVRRHMTETPPGMRREVVAIRIGAILIAMALMSGRERWWTLALLYPDTSELPLVDKVEWNTVASGFEIVDVPIVFRGEQVDLLHLARIDPAFHEFTVHLNRPGLSIESWQQKLGASLIINGGYYIHDESPETPVMTNGQSAGPTSYTSTHGALILDNPPHILEFEKVDAAAKIAPFRNAIVSYPLLLGSGGESKAGGHDDWLANRSFVAIDREGYVIFATTETGFFSLRRLGAFLRESRLNIVNAINLDGGPVAAQLVDAGNYRRVVKGRYESRGMPSRQKALHQRLKTQDWKLPIVISVHRLAAQRSASTD